MIKVILFYPKSVVSSACALLFLSGYYVGQPSLSFTHETSYKETSSYHFWKLMKFLLFSNWPTAQKDFHLRVFLILVDVISTGSLV